MIILQTFLAVIVVSLMAGPIAHFGLIAYGGPDLLVIGCWAFVWFANRSLALRWAVTTGLILDLVSFLPFGYWTLLLVAATMLMSYLAQHFLEASSLVQALLALLIGLITTSLLTSLATQQLVLTRFAFSIFSSLLLGALVYYVFAVRFRLLARWLGRRL